MPALNYGQAINTEFGKNRVQYHQDYKNWWMYETENFITYWYGKGRNVAKTVIQLSELDHDIVQRILEHRMNDKIEIIVYTDVSDLKQSNIGTEETFISKTGETKIIGNKMFVYFDGNHLTLRKKIREGIANVYLNNMLYGSGFQEILQNAVLLNIPDWYRQGIVAYAASPWDLLIEDELRDIWHSKPKYRDFKKLAEEYPRVAGHSFWFFIDQYYGKSTIANLLYLSKISRGIENSFEYILNSDIKLLSVEWEKFYKTLYERENGKFNAKELQNEIKLSNKKYAPISQIKLSPDGSQLLYCHNNQGKYRVVLRDIASGAEKVIFKQGYVNSFQETDFNYPILEWHPTKQEFSMLYDKKDVIYLRKYNLNENRDFDEQVIPNVFQRIYSLSYVNDLDYIFSGNTDGFADLYYYKSKNRNFDRLTNDFYDNLDAVYTNVNGENGILFSSNRTTTEIKEMNLDTILPIDNFDLYFLQMEGNKECVRLTNTVFENERYPFPVANGKISYLNDATGIINTYILDILTGNSYPVSNGDRNLIRHHSIANSDHYITTFYTGGAYKFYFEKLRTDVKVKVHTTESRSSWLKDNNQPVNEPLLIFKQEDEPETTMDEGFLFQSKFEDPKRIESISLPALQNKKVNVFSGIFDFNATSAKKIEPYNNTRAVAANKKFSLHNITTKLDNDLLFEGLETYTGDRQQLLTTPMGFLLKAVTKDLFEDYSVEAGIRIPTTFNGSEYFLIFDNNKRRLDKRYALYRKSNEYNSPEARTNNITQRSKKTTVLGMYQLKYPFDIYRSVRATSTLRFDRFLRLSTDDSSFNTPATNEKRVSLKLEYIYDNTHDFSLNIKHGTRYKFYTEVINEFDLKFVDGFDLNLSRGWTGIIGFDARHYIPVLKRSILAFRVSGATSFGSKKMLYYLGGMENWLLPKFDMSIPERQDADFAYKANVFQLRGFDNNIRNGASFLVGNTELRIPFMQYILGSRKGSAFFRNMQLTAFFDGGMAWHGITPFSPENPLNKIKISSPPLIELEIEYFRDPLVMGYGVGFRTQLLGYFIKLDYARGIETRVVQDPKLYLSMGLDF
ncbi:MAG: hypothetical protein IPM42_12945 [Saprospiraceae bacterium]|nr:hypothetical protein [Saprospiraceae bacterium]